MENFNITVSNGLLKDDHEERMGPAIWQYIWLLDKITKIDSDGLGLVLGGKPINLKDIAKNKSEATISRNLQRLEREGYIKMTHTPYGIVIKVTKAKKRFNKNVNPVEKKRFNKNDEPHYENDEPNKIVTVDITDDSTTSEATASPDQIVFVIDSFKEVNSSFGKWYANKTQRSAIARLIKIHSLEKVLSVIKILQKSNRIPYFPVITTPIQLEDKWSSLESALIKKKVELEDKKPKVMFS